MAASTKPPATGLFWKGADRASSTISKVCGSAPRYKPMKPSSSARDPRNVYRKNFRAERAALPWPQPAMTKYMPTSDRSKKTKNKIRSCAANTPRQADWRNRKSAACGLGRSFSLSA